MILLHLPDGEHSEAVRDAVIAALAALPAPLRQSLTWYQGSEMAYRCSSVRRPARGSDPAMRTPMGCCASTSPNSWPWWLPSLTPGRVRRWAGKLHRSGCRPPATPNRPVGPWVGGEDRGKPAMAHPNPRSDRHRCSLGPGWPTRRCASSRRCSLPGPPQQATEHVPLTSTSGRARVVGRSGVMAATAWWPSPPGAPLEGHDRRSRPPVASCSSAAQNRQAT